MFDDENPISPPVKTALWITGAAAALGGLVWFFSKPAKATLVGGGSGGTMAWTQAASGTVMPGDYFALAFDAPAGWTDGDVAKFKLSMASLGFDQGQYAQGAPLPPPYTSARGVAFQGKYIGTAPYTVASALPAGTAVAVLVLRPAAPKL